MDQYSGTKQKSPRRLRTSNGKLDFIHSSGVNSNISQTFKQTTRDFYHLS